MDETTINCIAANQAAQRVTALLRKYCSTHIALDCVVEVAHDSLAATAL